MRGLLAPRPRNESPVPITGRGYGWSLPWGGKTDTVGQLDTMATNGTVFGIVNRTSTAVAKTEWKLYRKAQSGNEDDRQEVTSHAALDLLNRPNQFFTRMLLMETEQQHVDLTGEGWLVVAYDQRMKNLPLELWPVRPDRMTPVPHPNKYLAGYVYTSPDGEKVPLDVNQVIHVRMPNPRDPYRGLGPVQSVLTEIDSADAAARWNANFFHNSAEPGGIVRVDRRLSDDDFQQLRQRWNEQHKGVSNAHRVAILEEAEWVERKYTQRDMQFSELRGISRDQILEAFGFPRSMLGITEDVNRANADAGEYVFAKWLTVPRLDRWRDAWNSLLLPLYGPTAKGLEFDYDSPVPEDEDAELAEMTAKANAGKSYIDAGFDGDSVVEALDLPEGLVWDKPEPPPMLPPPPPGGDPNQPPDPNGPPPPPGAPQPPEPPAAPGAHQRPHITANADDPEMPGRPSEGWPEHDPDTVDGIDLGPVQREWEKTVDATLRSWNNDVLPDWIDQLIDAVRAALRGDGSDLASLGVDIGAATALLTAAMAGMADTAAERTVKEAAKQKIDLLGTVPARTVLEEAASLTVRFEAQRLAASAGYEAARIAAGRTADEVGDLVRTHLESLSDAIPRQQIGAALSDAQNQARHNTFKTGPTGALYASEQLDTNTCKNCKAIHGRWICNTDDQTPLYKLYPHTGYVDCLGRDRCRGTVVGVWRKGQEGT